MKNISFYIKDSLLGTCRGDVLANIIDELHPDIIYYDEIECRLYNELPNI